MTKKDEASPRQRQIMEARWAKAREECPAGTCVPSSRFHVSGCPRKQVRIPRESLVVTNLNTGETSKAATVKDAMDANDKQAILMEPEPWTPFEKGQRTELFEPRIIPVPKPEDVRALTPDEEAKREQLVRKIESDLVVYPGLEQYQQAPARPWWKFWGRRG